MRRSEYVEHACARHEASRKVPTIYYPLSLFVLLLLLHRRVC
jgi:hypothetical protein